jgi:hypothetical protein
MAQSSEQGTGKHPHKSTAAPHPHHEAQSGKSGEPQFGGGDGQNRRQSSSSSSDLKDREYRDEKGEVHHHTHTYEEQHGEKK